MLYVFHVFIYFGLPGGDQGFLSVKLGTVSGWNLGHVHVSEL